MKRTLSKLLALVLIVTVIGAMAAVPAMASSGTTYSFAADSPAIMTKNLEIASDANVPNVTFAFSIEPGDAVDPTGTNHIEIKAGPTGATIPSISFTNSDTTTPGTVANDTDTTHKYASKAVSVNFPAGTFTAPGVYRYKISEVTTPAVSGVTYDTTTRYLDVFVGAAEDNTLSIMDCVLRTDAADINRPSGSPPTNSYDSGDTDGKSEGYTNSMQQYDFTFSKTVTGNQGDKNQLFTFTLIINRALPGTYPVVLNDVTGSDSITITGDNFSMSYALRDGSSVKVVGLNPSATCTLIEVPSDYTASYSIDEGEPGSGVSTSAILMDADHSVVFNNDRTGTVPTGILLTIAPFAVGLLLFGSIVIFLVAKKRRAEEED